MNDLRSLEGIGQLLSQKLNRAKFTKSRNRNHSDPLSMFIPNSNDDSSINISTPTHGQHNNNKSDSYTNSNQNHSSHDISTPICEYFPAEIAQLLSTNIQNGYNQSLQSQPPKLVKSISDCGNFNDLNWFNCSPHDYRTNNNDNNMNNNQQNIAYNNNNNDTIDNESLSNSIQLHHPQMPSLTTIGSTTGSNITYHDDEQHIEIAEDSDDEQDTIFELQLPEMGESTTTIGFPSFESPPMITFDSPPPISFIPPPSLAPITIELPTTTQQSLTISQTNAPSTPDQGLYLDLDEDECNHTSTSRSDDHSKHEQEQQYASFQPLMTSKNEISFIKYTNDDQKDLESVDNDTDTDTDYDDDEDENDIEFINFKDDYMEYVTKNKVNNIGTGASGIVTKAFHYNSCVMVAIKQCRSKQKHESSSFIKEAKLYEQFEDNKNIINVLDFGRDIVNGELKMTLEYMDLGSTDSLNIDKNIGNLDWKYRENIVGHIILNLLNGLSDLHKLGYIHNDIKPANILCNKYGEIKLSDFGLVSKLDYKNGIYFHKKNCGTQRYQSPEKLIKSPSKYNTKSDIWSVGVTAFELLFGIINGKSELWYIYGKATNVLNDGHSSHSLSNECCDFINKCLIVDDESRPNIEELLQHSWLKYIKTCDINNKWPWIKLIDNKQINIDELYNMSSSNPSTPSSPSPSCTNMDKQNCSEKHEMKRSLVPFEFISERFSDISLSQSQSQQQTEQTQSKCYNTDLLFMISALIIHYCQKNIDLTPNGHRTKHSMYQVPNESGYSDDERISNIAHYALCSKEMVINRIQRTVNYIKSQLNNPEITRVDS